MTEPSNADLMEWAADVLDPVNPDERLTDAGNRDFLARELRLAAKKLRQPLARRLYSDVRDAVLGRVQAAFSRGADWSARHG